MGLIDWLIVILPLSFVMGMGIYSRKYARSVADFVQAGRICGRYVISIGDVANALAIITMVAYIEVHYRTGFALAFWNSILAPLGIALSLFGYVTYRFRETKAMSLGQFLEMRYNRALRIFGATLRSVAEVLANMIMPALAARFFIYYLNLPQTVTVCGITVSTFIIVVLISLTLAISLICLGGTICLVITDAIQGLFLYPIMVILVAFILYKFSWTEEIARVMADRAPGESFLNPYDLSRLRDFNLFSLVVTVFSTFFSGANWIGAGTSGAAKSPHEQKMAGILGAWRYSLGSLLYIIVAIGIITFLNHAKYADEARIVKTQISTRISEELIVDTAEREKFAKKIEAIPAIRHRIGVDAPLGEKKNLDTPYLEAAHQEFLAIEKRAPAALKGQKNGNAIFAQFKTLYHQLMLAMTMRHIFPPGLLGLFCIFMVLAMLSTDDTRIFSATLTITQDVIAPFFDLKKLTPRMHLWLFRFVAIGIGIVFFIGSFFMEQLDYINLFVTMVVMMWCGGAGPVMIFGLYSRFGTTAGAFSSLISGMVLSLGSLFVQRNWADLVYPWLDAHGWVEPVGRFLTTVSKPLNPYVVWEMNAVKMPINAYEMNFIVMVLTLVIYCVVSWCTLKEPFNLDRMLHRGIYNTDGENKTREPLTLNNILRKMVSITPEYTKGDRFITWAMFYYSFVYGFVVCFLVVLIWNIVWPWPNEWWSAYFLIKNMIIPGICAVISVFWFGIGGTVDLIHLFKDLEKRVVDELDNGMVEGNVSLSDIKEFQKREEEAQKK